MTLMHVTGRLHTFRVVWLFIAAALPFAVALLSPLRVSAGGVVTNCANDADFNAKLAGGGAISFNCGPNPISITLSSLKTITLDTSIDGGGVITLSGGGIRQLFMVNSGARLDLKNLVIADGFATTNGGAIRNDGTLNIDHSTLRNNKTNAAGSGGAIVNYGVLTISSSLLEQNEAANGGALFPRFNTSRTTISNSILRYNQTTSPTDGWGGAILAWDGAPVLITGSTFELNTARYGGGIYIYPHSVVTLSASSLINNVASDTGSAGGGIYNASLLIATQSQFKGNAAPGAQANGGGIASLTATTVLTDVDLSGNTAGNQGGGVFNYVSYLFLKDTTLSTNIAITGGGLYNYVALAALNGGSISNNSAANGAGVYVNAAILGMTDVRVSGNTASQFGGGLFNGFHGDTSLIRVMFDNNKAANNGGGIASALSFPLHLFATTFFANEAGNGGGLHLASGSVTADYLMFDSNTAVNRGGGIGISGGTISANHSTFARNVGSLEGGGIFSSVGAQVYLQNSTFDSNVARTGNGGGLLNLANGVAQLTNVTLSGNTALSQGGGISNESTMSLLNVTLSGNGAPGGGGAIRNSPGMTLVLTNTLIAYSTSGGNCNGTIFTAKFTLSSDNTCVLGAGNNQISVDPLLTALGNYGGATLVHMLKPGSPAIDAVIGNDAPGFDQRGILRPQIGGYDIGAVERQMSEPIVAPRVYLPLLKR